MKKQRKETSEPLDLSRELIYKEPVKPGKKEKSHDRKSSRLKPQKKGS